MIHGLIVQQGAAHNSRPGVCRCGHPRLSHTAPRGPCKWAAPGPKCPCTDFLGPVDVVLKVGTRAWPLVYTMYGRVAHILEPYISSDSSDPAICGVHPFPMCWRGAGTPKENDRVQVLPLCARCTRVFEKTQLERKA